MNLVVFFTIFLSGHPLFADQRPLDANPSEFCSSAECSPRMQEISNQYKSGNSEFANHILSAYSGDCFHLSPYWKPEDQHYAVFVFENGGADLSISGYFGFFFKDDPYLNSTPKEIKADLKRNQVRANPGALYPSYAKLSFADDGSLIEHWYRSSADQSHVYLISRWQDFGKLSDLTQYIFCDLTRR